MIMRRDTPINVCQQQIAGPTMQGQSQLQDIRDVTLMLPTGHIPSRGTSHRRHRGPTAEPVGNKTGSSVRPLREAVHGVISRFAVEKDQPLSCETLTASSRYKTIGCFDSTKSCNYVTFWETGIDLHWMAMNTRDCESTTSNPSSFALQIYDVQAHQQFVHLSLISSFGESPCSMLVLR
jgi:hypothetical protein